MSSALATTLFSAGYVFCVAGMNCICYLISSFYHKKFDEQSPRAGFLLATLLSLLLLLSFAAHHPDQLLRTLQVIVLCMSSTLSVWNAVLLYYTMKRVRK